MIALALLMIANRLHHGQGNLLLAFETNSS
jgi:hypothetical protein